MSLDPLSLHPRTLVSDEPGHSVAGGQAANDSGQRTSPSLVPGDPGGTQADLDNLLSAPAAGVVSAIGANFPHPYLIAVAVSLFTEDPAPRRTGHPRARIEIAPGVVRLRRHSNPAPKQHAPSMAEMCAEGYEAVSRAEVTSWSQKSRVNMTRTLAALDYGPMFASGLTPAMVTYTLPGDWLAIAPDGATFKRLVKRLFSRLDRVWGPVPLVWKLEFQRRGAPHLHTFMCIPTDRRRCRCRVCGSKGGGVLLGFRDWISHQWAHICSAPDPAEYARHLAAGTGIDYREGLRASDPKRLAIYFAKHGGAGGGKEYQHQIPPEWVQLDRQTGELRETSGPGRFWGYRHLEQTWAGVDVAPEDATAAVRIMRRWSERQVSRFPGQTYSHRTELRTRTYTKRNGRKSRRRTKYVRGTSGFVLPNDGPAFASQLARALEAQR